MYLYIFNQDKQRAKHILGERDACVITIDPQPCKRIIVLRGPKESPHTHVPNQGECSALAVW